MNAVQLELLPYTKEEKLECNIQELKGEHAHLRRSFFARHGEHEKRLDKIEIQLDEILTLLRKSTSELPAEDTLSSPSRCQVYYI